MFWLFFFFLMSNDFFWYVRLFSTLSSFGKTVNLNNHPWKCNLLLHFFGRNRHLFHSQSSIVRVIQSGVLSPSKPWKTSRIVIFITHWNSNHVCLFLLMVESCGYIPPSESPAEKQSGVSLMEDEAKPIVSVFNIFKQVRFLIATYEHT